MSNPKRIQVGVVSGAHGVRGALVLKSFTDPPLNIFNYTSLYLTSGVTVSPVFHHNKTKNTFVVSMEGITDRCAADQLKHQKLFISETDLKDLSQDTFYHHNLLGLKVIDENAHEYGKITAIFNHGASDIFEITGDDTYLLPFIEDAIIEMKNDYIIINTNFLT